MIVRQFNRSGGHVAIQGTFGWIVFARFQLKPDGTRVRVSCFAVLKIPQPTDPNHVAFLPTWMKPMVPT